MASPVSLPSLPDTIHTIAREAGVSVATVSRVINHPALVSEETRSKVLRVIEDRNFRGVRRRRRRGSHLPQLLTLSEGSRRGRIGFLVGTLPSQFSDPITEEMYRGIHRVLSARGLELVLDHYLTSQSSSDPLPVMLREDRVDGVLLRPPANRETLLAFCRGRKAVVLGNAHADVNVPCVVVDDMEGMRMVMSHLLELGHRRIAFIGGSTQSLLNLRRLQSYRMSLLEHGLPLEDPLVKLHAAWLVTPEEEVAASRRFLDELLRLSRPPTALVTSMDGWAVRMLQAARERGLQAPRDFSITGYGNRDYSLLTEPPLTTVHMDQEATGEVAASLLLAILDGAAHPAQTLVRPQFVPRSSCAAPPVRAA